MDMENRGSFLNAFQDIDTGMLVMFHVMKENYNEGFELKPAKVGVFIEDEETPDQILSWKEFLESEKNLENDPAFSSNINHPFFDEFLDIDAYIN